MKRKMKWILALSLVSSLNHMALAQDLQSLEADVDADIDQMYQSAPRSQSKGTQGAVVTQTIVVPQTTQQAAPVQKQAATYIEASPLSDSRADSIRRNRQDEEMKTESRIVEKLEQSRMEDEKRRASVLFGDKFDALNNNQQQVQPQQAPPSYIPPQVIAPAYSAPVEERETLSRDAVREEVRAALNEDAEAVTPLVEQRYFAGIAGFSQYPDVQAIRGNGTLGAAFGTRMMNSFLVEGAFLYSSFNLDAWYTDGYNMIRYGNFDMNQYQGVISAKYQLLDGFVRPVLGGQVAYSYRKYTAGNYTYTSSSNGEVGNSHAVDMGVTVGADLEFNDRFSLGVDMKYFFNVYNRLSGPTAPGVKPLEKLNYFLTGLTARINF